MKRFAMLAAAFLATGALCVQAMPPPQAAADTVSGEVLEVKDVDSYTYLRLKTKDGETWAAVSKAPVKKGDKVTLAGVSVMENFPSKSLNRTFDRILFATLVGPEPTAGAAPAKLHGTTSSAPVAKVDKAAGTDAKTVAETVNGRSALKDKTVTIRGQVVKVNSGILGKNWVHLQDGSGKAAEGTHDILVTTADTIGVGEIVNAQGTVRTDVTIGPGYAYAVMLEDAKLRK